MSRISVLVVAVVAFLLALNPQESILGLVGNAWGPALARGLLFGHIVVVMETDNSDSVHCVEW